jgi:hypothetical protein
VETITAKFGPDRQETLGVVLDLAVTHMFAGQWRQAERLLEHALPKWQASYGSDDGGTVRCRELLADVYANLGRPRESLDLNEANRKFYEETLGRDHIDTLQHMYVHALHLLKAGMRDEADRLARDILVRAQERGGKMGRNNMARAQDLLAGNLLLNHEYAAAELLLREAWAINQADRPNYWRTFGNMSRLGGALLGQKQYAAAEPLILGGYEGLRQRANALGARYQPRITEAGELVVRFYEATGQVDQARAWRAKLSTAPPTDRSP